MRNRFLYRSLLSALILSMAVISTSCGSLDQSLSRITTVTSSETSDVPSETTKSSTEDSYAALEDITRSYMDTLVSGDLASVCEKYGYKQNEVLQPASDLDDLVFSILFQSSTYNVVSVITSDHSNYSVNVDLSFPDLASCFDTVLADREFMMKASRDWVFALKNKEDGETQKEKMLDYAFKEALGRVRVGEFTDKKVYSGFFKFHKNPDEYICEGFPEFVRILGTGDYIIRFAYVDILEEYDILNRCVKYFVSNGEITEEEANTILSEKLDKISQSMTSET